MDAIAERNPGIRKALTIEEMFWKEKEERRRYEMRQKYLRDEVSMLAGAKAGPAGRPVGSNDKAHRPVFDTRFDQESATLQTMIGRLTDPAVAERVYAELLIANSLEEADRILSDAVLHSQHDSSVD